ncbi:MAG: PspC domain-containing protein [Firmicutes bacterium]|nr:PspC domain-containing protein [Bacillota bacterium]
MGKRLYLSESDKKISGVCGGIGEYFDIDSTLVRLGWVVLTVFSAGIGGLLVYIVASIVIPKQQQNI